jgi:predicted regulator of Ras-like GTPase activity (Roadblock/LC7/MglB family)
MAGELEAILNEMKSKGIGGAIVRVDGVPIASTIPLNDISAGLLSSVANVSDAMMKKLDDRQSEIEVSFGTSILYMIPVRSHVFCALIKEREEKKVVVDYALKAKDFL